MSYYVMCYGVIPKASCIMIETQRLQSKEIIDKRSIELVIVDSLEGQRQAYIRFTLNT